MTWYHLPTEWMQTGQNYMYNICENCINKEHGIRRRRRPRPRKANGKRNAEVERERYISLHITRFEQKVINIITKWKTFDNINGQRYLLMGVLAEVLALISPSFRNLSIHNRFIDNHLQFINFYCNFKSNVLCAYMWRSRDRDKCNNLLLYSVHSNHLSSELFIVGAGIWQFANIFECNSCLFISPFVKEIWTYNNILTFFPLPKQTTTTIIVATSKNRT